jgi:hypothetical protein
MLAPCANAFDQLIVTLYVFDWQGRFGALEN